MLTLKFRWRILHGLDVVYYKYFDASPTMHILLPHVDTLFLKIENSDKLSSAICTQDLCGVNFCYLKMFMQSFLPLCLQYCYLWYFLHHFLVVCYLSLLWCDIFLLIYSIPLSFMRHGRLFEFFKSEHLFNRY